MYLEEIKKMAQYQNDNWKELHGVIVDFDIKTKKLTIEDERGKYHDFKMNDNALDQAFKRIGIRGTRNDFKDNHDFVQLAVMKKVNDGILNEKLSPTKVIYDINDNRAKSVMTKKYRRLPNIDILKYIEKEYGGINPDFSHINEWGMKLTVGGKDNTFRSYDNDDFIHGINLGNSETGNGSLSASQFLLRVICGNGWVTNYQLNMMKFAHIYDNLQEILKRELKKMGDITRIIPLINKAKRKGYSVETIEEMPRRLSQLKIPNRHHKGILSAFNIEPLGLDNQNRINDWGIFNAITRYVSHDFKQRPDWTLREQNQLMKVPFQLIYMR